MSCCLDKLVFNTCADCDEIYVEKLKLCKNRFCSVCNPNLFLWRYSQMQSLIGELQDIYPDSPYSLITLTAKNCSLDELDGMMNFLSDSWDRLLQKHTARRGFWGWAKNVSVVYNQNINKFRLRYYVLAMWETENKSDAVIESWMRSIGNDELIIDLDVQSVGGIDYTKPVIEESLADTICKTFKRIDGPKCFNKLSFSDFEKFLSVVSGRKLIAFGGTIRQFVRELDINFNSPDSNDYFKLYKFCSSSTLDKFIYHWSFGWNGLSWISS